MKIKILLLSWLVTLVVNSILAGDVFPVFEKKAFDFCVPTNLAGCLSDSTYLVGTNYVYHLNGQYFSPSQGGHIQTVAEGFDGRTDKTTPWQTLTELLAAYQNGSLESQVRPLYTDSSNAFLTAIYGNAQMKARFEMIGRSITGMEPVLGYDYLNGYLAQVRLGFQDGHHEVSQFYFVSNSAIYELAAPDFAKPEPSFINIGVCLNTQPYSTNATIAIPDADQYRLVFDITQSAYRHGTEVVYGFVLIAIGTLIAVGTVWRRWKKRPARGGAVRQMAPLFLAAIIFVIWGVATFRRSQQNFEDYLKLQTAARNSQFETMEGLVDRFRPPTRQSAAQFFVNGVEFRCRAGSMQNGFNQDDLIKNGLRIRIGYVPQVHGNEIVRLEIAGK